MTTRRLITRAATLAALALIALTLWHLTARAADIHRRNYCAALATPHADPACRHP